MAEAKDLPLQEIINCQLPVWYEKFSKYTAKTCFIAVSEEFIAYLKQDGVVLPEGCDFPEFETTEQDSDDSSDEWSDGDESYRKENDHIGLDGCHGDSDGDHSDCHEDLQDDRKCQTHPTVLPSLTDLTKRLHQSIAELGGEAFPKLNWSAPRDAGWVLPTNCLKCTSPADVYLLMKSSNFIHHDLSRVFEYCTDGKGMLVPPNGYKICLRRWVSINPSSEFRCFVKDRTLIGISQRYPSSCYKHVAQGKDRIRDDICNFHSKVLHQKFPNSSYVFDVYQEESGRYRLVDINPFAEMTDALLFAWTELRQWACPGEGGMSRMTPDIRVIESEGTIRSSDLHSAHVPKDIADVSSSEGIEEFIKLFKNRKL